MKNGQGGATPKKNGMQCSEVRCWHGLKVNHPQLDTAIRSVVRWYNEGEGALVLAGGYGCGKTSLAKLVYQFSGGPIILTDWNSPRLEQVVNATFYSEPDLLEEIRKSYHGEGEAKIVSRCQKSKLLILDDLGAAYVKEESGRWYEDIMWRIFDNRKDKKTLITTNLDPFELKKRIGGRCWSRLQEMLGSGDNFVGMFNVPDYRAIGF